jgi:unsaturated rhamnogalacturonyl hydrolase
VNAHHIASGRKPDAACAICHSSTMMSRPKIATGQTPIFRRLQIRAAITLLLSTAALSQPPVPAKKIVVDAWFNSQQRKNASGQMEYFHYKWNDTTDSGFSEFEKLWKDAGVDTGTLYTAPTTENLKDAQFYLIVSPDIPVKNPHPHYLQEHDGQQVAQWVKQGGVLILMENDPANADIEHLNLLAERFGIHFKPDLSHHVVGEQIGPGRILAHGPPFQSQHVLYMKDTCTIALKAPAVALLQDSSGPVMAWAKYGKGTVFAVVDPWLYNEYVSGKHLPAEYDNLAAGKEWVHWLLQQTPEK